jgi:hypothetical protein
MDVSCPSSPPSRRVARPPVYSRVVALIAGIGITSIASSWVVAHPIRPLKPCRPVTWFVSSDPSQVPVLIGDIGMRIHLLAKP